MYRNESEEKLLKQVNLSDLTAVNYLKDPKGRRQHMFGLFTPSRNYQFQAPSSKEAQEWVELIRAEARIDEEEESLMLASPPADRSDPLSYRALGGGTDGGQDRQAERFASSSPEPTETFTAKLRDGVRVPGARQASYNELDYSGQEHGSYEYSDLSDGAAGAAASSLPKSITREMPSSKLLPATTNTTLPLRPATDRNPSAISTSAAQPAPTVQPKEPEDEQRVIWQGFLLCLKSKGGVRQWKRLWVVLRPKHLALYKTEEVSIPPPCSPFPRLTPSFHSTPISSICADSLVKEYSAQLLIPMTSILSAIEIDPISRSKAHCLQIIAEDRNYRFCAPSEEASARCLGAIKSLLAKRKEREKEREREAALAGHNQTTTKRT